jgi:hypothetical protein
MTEEEVTPLFWPGESMRVNARFVCNIGDELSLWNVGKSLRAYGQDGFGIWLDSEKAVKRHIDKIDQYPNSVTLHAIARNFEAVVVYMRMLQGDRQ